ncbi:hypothetical protein H072_10888, partial [Dactylellina haptotyla CBS 200.50]
MLGRGIFIGIVEERVLDCSCANPRSNRDSMSGLGGGDSADFRAEGSWEEIDLGKVKLFLDAFVAE